MSAITAPIGMKMIPLRQCSRTAATLVTLFLLLFATACSSEDLEPGPIVEPGTQSSSTSVSATQDAFAAKYAELREQGKSHKAASELARIHTSDSMGSDNPTDAEGRRSLDAAVVLARFSTTDSHKAAQREQAAEELKIRFQSRDLAADRALNLLDKIAPEASSNKRRIAAANLARLSRADNWDDGNTIQAAGELTRLITGDALDADNRIKAANELARRSTAGELHADRALNLIHDIAPELSIEERREAAANLVRLSKSQEWDFDTTKQAAEVTFQPLTGGELEYDKRRDSAVDLSGEAIKKFGGDDFKDEDVDVATELIKKSLSGDLDGDSVSDLLNLQR
jgi:hypothetical protein